MPLLEKLGGDVAEEGDREEEAPESLSSDNPEVLDTRKVWDVSFMVVGVEVVLSPSVGRCNDHPRWVWDTTLFSFSY